MCFPVNMANCLRTPILKNICEWLLLSFMNCINFIDKIDNFKILFTEAHCTISIMTPRFLAFIFTNKVLSQDPQLYLDYLFQFHAIAASRLII